MECRDKRTERKGGKEERSKVWKGGKRERQTHRQRAERKREGERVRTGQMDAVSLNNRLLPEVFLITVPQQCDVKG